MINLFKVSNSRTTEVQKSLDVYRTLTIMLGLLWHFMQINRDNNQLNLILSTGPWGGANPLFLVSGYLLGNQIFSRYVQGKKVSLLKFYLRRALKTWPSYIVLILIIFSIPFYTEKESFLSIWKFLTFTQNFNFSNNALSHTWSLCIEEHFYLVLPFISLLFIKKPKLKVVITYIILVVLVGILIRGYIWFEYLKIPKENFFKEYFNKIYYQTYCRIDGLALGVFLAYLKNYQTKIWDKLEGSGNSFLNLGLSFCLLGFIMQIKRTALLPALLVFPIISLGFGFILMGAIDKKSYFNKIRFPYSNVIATMSYALYLVHKPVYYFVESQLSKFEFNIIMELIISIFLSYLVSFIAAYFLYVIVENPILKFRDRYIPSIEMKDKYEI